MTFKISNKSIITLSKIKNVACPKYKNTNESASRENNQSRAQEK